MTIGNAQKSIFSFYSVLNTFQIFFCFKNSFSLEQPSTWPCFILLKRRIRVTVCFNLNLWCVIFLCLNEIKVIFYCQIMVKNVSLKLSLIEVKCERNFIKICFSPLSQKTFKAKKQKPLYLVDKTSPWGLA